jgi:hypothetical protein
VVSTMRAKIATKLLPIIQSRFGPRATFTSEQYFAVPAVRS